MTDCNGCGRCCWPVVLPYTRNDVELGGGQAAGFEITAEDRRWIMEDLEPISRRQGVPLVADHMHGAVTEYLVIDRGQTDIQLVWSFFFRCRNYDEANRRCLIYDRRPPMCRDYPWYQRPPDDQKALPPECSYNADIGRPVAVTMGATR